MTASQKYDFLIVGSGMYGASLARLLTDRGCRVLVVEKREHIAGNVYTEFIDGICVHVYGPHIFHTDNESVWNFVNRFARFNEFINQPCANYHGELYSLPFNMNTFREMWGVTDPDEARAIIYEQIIAAGFGGSEESEQETGRTLRREGACQGRGRLHPRGRGTGRLERHRRRLRPLFHQIFEEARGERHHIYGREDPGDPASPL